MKTVHKTVCIIILFFTFVTSTIDASITKSSAFSNLITFNDVTWSDDVIMTSRPRSLLECAAWCEHETSCVTFTFTKTPNKICQSHSEFMVPGKAISTTPYTLTFGKSIFYRFGHKKCWKHIFHWYLNYHAKHFQNCITIHHKTINKIISLYCSAVVLFFFVIRKMS